MSTLRHLRKVNKFPSRPGTFIDPFSKSALYAVSGPSGRTLMDEIQSTWHRPSGELHILEENLMEFGGTTPPRCTDGDYLAILKKTLDEIKPAGKIIPLTLGGAMKHSDFPTTTSPGFPWVTQGFHTKADVIADKRGTGQIHRAWDSIGRGLPWSLPDVMAFSRVIASEKTKSKIRPVWGYPIDVVAEEARYFLPLMEQLKGICNKRDAFYGLGMETALSGHRHLARSMNLPTVTTCMCADQQRFDASVTAWIIRDVFSYVSDWFDFTRVRDSEGKVWSVKPEQTCRRWKAMISYFINTKIRTPSGLRVQKDHGVPSGTMFTNFIDTVVNAVQMRTAIYRVTGELPVKDYYYGDDSVGFLRESIDLTALADVLLATFNATLSVDKTLLTENPDNIQWLGYYHRDNGPERDMRFILASTLFPEREVHTPLDAAARLLGQMYSCMHPRIAVVFYDAVMHLLRLYSLSPELLELYVTSLSSKSMKYLTTLGLTPHDITVPTVSLSPHGTREILSVLPKPCARQFNGTPDLNLPEWAFAPEAYSNRHLRVLGFFHDFYYYQQTRTYNQEDMLEDLRYFTD